MLAPTSAASVDASGAPREQRRNSIELMIRIETMQGTLARRGFVDAVAAGRVIDHWADEMSHCLMCSPSLPIQIWH